MKAWKYIMLLTSLITVLLSACSSPVSPINPSSSMPSNPGNTVTLPPAALPADRVEVVYFYMPMRCSTCLCFEERVSFVVNTYFQEEMASGKLSFTVCEQGDRKKAALIRRYNAFSTQLFVNTIQNNVDNIKYIEEIWSWLCIADEQGFDAKVRTLIEQALEDVG